MRLFDKLAINGDAHNRTMLSPFKSLTGRNQPSNSKFVFGPTCWVRSLIQPAPGKAIAYIDWASQELAISAALSRDRNLMDVYSAGDPYMKFRRRWRVRRRRTPTKKSHPACAAVQGVHVGRVAMARREFGLSQRLGCGNPQGQGVAGTARLLFPDFWEWSTRCVDHAMLAGYLDTRFGWRVHVLDDMKANPRSLMNYWRRPTAPEMMRTGLYSRRKPAITVNRPVHDALVVEADAGDIDDAVAETRTIMEWAGREVLDGFTVADRCAGCAAHRIGTSTKTEAGRLGSACRDLLGRIRAEPNR